MGGGVFATRSTHRLLAAALTVGILAPRVGTAFVGLAPDEPWKPGKLDLHVDRTGSAERANLFWWSPVVKAGIGVLDVDGVETRYGGGYVRGVRRGLELIAGGGLVDREEARDFELQAELRLPGGIAFGGGAADYDGAVPDVTFGKAVHRGRIGSWSTVLALQVQEVGRETSSGGYAGLWEDRFMAVIGADGEQRQATVAFMAPQAESSTFRPVLEGIWIDQEVGDLAGPQILFVNGTLGFQGGFLSHPARLGRAMGPTGVEYANPLGFLWANGPWNRRLDPWELGRLGDLRLLRVERPNGVTSATWEALVFPLQLAGREGLLDGIFVGASYRTLTGTDDDPGPLAGYIGKVGFLQLALAVDVGLESDDTRATLGIIDNF
jgi:hypothetical protein